MWKSVRAGEEKHIFPYENQADVMFNSGLLYEYAAISPMAAPLLAQIQPNSPYYSDAQRLTHFVENFQPMDTSYIPQSSIIREFIGGGCFKL
jgi:uridine kinase